MNIITITREYGAGGGEVARKLAAALGWELLDRELLHQAAEVEHVPDAELERLDEKARHDGRPLPPASAPSKIPARPEDGRGDGGRAGQRGSRGPWRAGTCWASGPVRSICGWWPRSRGGPSGCRSWKAGPLDESMARCTEMDRIRSRFARYFFGDKATQPAEYDLVFNTQRVALDDVAAVAVAIVRGDSMPAPGRSAPRRVLTLSRELGAGEQGFPPTLGERLGMRVYDRELLEQEAVRLGVPEAELEKIDERGAGIFQRFRPGSIYQRYFEVLGQLMRELADRGNVILVGRGGSRILRDEPTGFPRPPGGPHAGSSSPRDGVSLGSGGGCQEADCRQRLPAEQLLRKLPWDGLVQPLGIRRDRQQRPAWADGRGGRGTGRRAVLAPR